MEGALAWIGSLAEWFGQWIPRIKVIQANEAGVKWVRGKKVCKLEPGIIVYWPIFTNVQVTPTARQTLHTHHQTLTTLDARTITFSLVLVYKVTDPVAALNRTWEYEDCITDVAQTAALSEITKRTYEDLYANLGGDVERHVLAAARNILRVYGVKVEKVGFINFTPTRALRLMGDSQ